MNLTDLLDLLGLLMVTTAGVWLWGPYALLSAGVLVMVLSYRRSRW